MPTDRPLSPSMPTLAEQVQKLADLAWGQQGCAEKGSRWITREERDTQSKPSADALVGSLNDRDGGVRRLAREGLQFMYWAALPSLLEAFNHPDARTRTGALWVIAKLGDGQRSIAANVIPLLKDKDVRVRRLAVQALSEIESRPV